MSIRLFTYKKHDYHFAPTWLAWLITLLCIPVFINFGLWQYDKAQTKKAIQEKYQQANNHTVLKFPVNQLTLDAQEKENWAYKKVRVTGHYVAEYGFLLDNQVEGTRAGYHVITPLQIEGTSQHVLINRGWIPGNIVHADVPTVETPTATMELEGQVWVPSEKFFTLEKPDQTSDGWAPVWQNMDMKKYKEQVPFAVSPLAIKMDKQSDAGGFVRNWQVPVKRIATHLGYAFQWFGFAIATLLIFLYLSVKRKPVKVE